MAATTAAVLPHHRAILALLHAGLDAVMTGYDGEIDSTPPLDQDKRLHGYWVLHSGTGIPRASALDGESSDLDWKFTVTVAGGDVQRCLRARDRVCTVLVDAEPVIAGRASHRVRLDYDMGPPRRFDDPQPPRFAVPLLFTLATIPA